MAKTKKKDYEHVLRGGVEPVVEGLDVIDGIKGGDKIIKISVIE